MPGIIGMIASVCASAYASTSTYGTAQLNFIFPETANGRSGSKQAQIQLAYLFITLGTSIVGGLIGGFFTRKINPPKKFFLDDEYWEVPELELPYYFDKRGEISRIDEVIHQRESEDKKATISIDKHLETRLIAMEEKITKLNKNIKKAAVLGNGTNVGTGTTDPQSLILGLSEALKSMIKNQRKDD